MVLECHWRLAEVLGVQFFTASPNITLRMMPSRSIALETARRKSRCLNHEYFNGPTSGSPTFLPGFGSLTVLRLNHKKFVLSEGPRSYRVKFSLCCRSAYA